MSYHQRAGAKRLSSADSLCRVLSHVVCKRLMLYKRRDGSAVDGDCAARNLRVLVGHHRMPRPGSTRRRAVVKHLYAAKRIHCEARPAYVVATVIACLRQHHERLRERRVLQRRRVAVGVGVIKPVACEACKIEVVYKHPLLHKKTCGTAFCEIRLKLAVDI